MTTPALWPNAVDGRFDRDLLVKELRAHLRGEVFDSYPDRLRYSLDESIFTLLPSVVVAPKDEADLQAVVSIARLLSVPITARGGGTGVAGQSIGSGIVVDFTRHFKKNSGAAQDHVTVQPGVVLQALNAELAKSGRRIAPDPGSRATCTIGGMVATNASGPHSYLHGSTRDHVRRLRVVLADGEAVETADLPYRFPTLHEAVAAQKERVIGSFPRVQKNSSGYPLEELIFDPPNYARFLTGTEGTLALTSEIEMKTIPLPSRTALAIFPYPSLEAAVEALPAVRCMRPAALELLDRYILEALARENAALLGAVGLAGAKASLWVEWENEIPSPENLGDCRLIEDAAGQSLLWTMRSKSTRLLHEQAAERKPLRCIEDCVVPPERLGEYVARLREILKRHDCEGAIFGHAGDGHLHVNPRIDVTAPHLPARIERLMEEVYDLVIGMDGSISAEHGDGILRRRFAEKQWGEVLPLFHLVKEVFDPTGIFNPDKKFPVGRPLTPPFRDFKTYSPGSSSRSAFLS